MAGVDFKDHNNATKWLVSQDVKVQCAITSRAGLRAIANFVGAEHLSQEEFQRFTLGFLRALLISSTFASRHSSSGPKLQSVGQQALEYVSGLLSENRKARERSSKDVFRTLGPLINAGNVAREPLTAMKASPAGMNAITESASSVSSAELKMSNTKLESPTFQRLLKDALAREPNRPFEKTANKALSKFNSQQSDNANSANGTAFAAANQDANNPRLTDFDVPVWQDHQVPYQTQRNHERFLEILATGQPLNGFWHDWYRAMWQGTFDDWDLAEKVALIPDEVWERGAAAVAEEIETIKAKLLLERLPQAEIIFEDEDGRYEVKSEILDPSTLTDSVLSRVTFAFQTALDSNACDLNPMSLPAKLLRHTIENCTDDPNAIEQFFRQASDMIKQKVNDAQSADDDELKLLVRTLDESALQMRADHPEVAAAAQARVKQALKEMDDAKRLEAAALMHDMVEVSGPRLGAEFSLSAETTRSASAPEAQASAIKMSGERAAKISILERGKKAESSGAMAWAKIAFRANKLVELVQGLLSGII